MAKTGRKRGSSNLKTWQCVGYRTQGLKKVIQVLVEVDARSEDEASRAGRNYAKMMGVQFSHSIEKLKN